MTILAVSSGVTSSGLALQQYDALNVLSGGVVVSTLVGFEGDLFVRNGGAASFTTVDAGGGAFIQGSATGTLVNSGGMEFVSTDGSAIFTVVNAGGGEVIGNDGLTTSSLLASGASQVISSGGIAFAALVGGTQLISNGGFAEDAVIASGGLEEVFSGGTTNSAAVQSGGVVLVLPGAVVTNAALAPGGAIVSSGVVVNSPGGTTVYAHEADGLAIGPDDAAYVLQSGVTRAMVVNGGGVAAVDSGGAAYASLVLGGGGLVVSGGVVFGTVLSGRDALSHSYDNILAGGVASDTIVDSGGGENVSGGRTAGAVLNSGGAQFVQSGAASSTLINDGGFQYIGPSGVALSTIIASGGSENVSGGVAYATQVDSFGREVVAFGGLVSGTVVDSAGVEYLGPGGSASGTDLASGSFQILAGGEAVDTVVGRGGVEIVSGNPRFESAFSDAVGSVIEGGGSEVVDAKGIATDATIAGGVLELDSGGTVSGGIDFTGAGGALFVETAVMPEAVITGFAGGDSIFLAALGYAPGDSVSVAAPGEVVISAGGESYALNISGAVGGVTNFRLDDLNDAVLLTENAPCFAAGTRILTPRGEVAVEALAAGDKVITDAGEDAVITWMGRRRIDLRRHAKPALARPVRIAADAFDAGIPCRDLYLSPDHAVFLEGVLVPVKALANGGSVAQVAWDEVVYYHVELAAHAVIFAERMAVESYLESGNRGAFENSGGAVMLHPDFSQGLREVLSCAPFVESGVVVERARRALWRRQAAGGARAARL